MYYFKICVKAVVYCFDNLLNFTFSCLKLNFYLYCLRDKNKETFRIEILKMALKFNKSHFKID